MNEAVELAEELSELMEAGLVHSNVTTFALSLIHPVQATGEATPLSMMRMRELISYAVRASPEELQRFPNVVHLFHEARKKIKYPSLAIDALGLPLILRLAGQKSQYYMDVLIVGLGKYPESQWYGRLSASNPCGEFLTNIPPQNLVYHQIISGLHQLNFTPSSYLAMQGQKTGNCCCCGLELTNEESIAKGMGPICSVKWGV